MQRNEAIKLARNPDYWKEDRPYLDGIEYSIVPNRSTEVLGFIAGKFDVTFPYLSRSPLFKDVQNQVPDAACELHTDQLQHQSDINRGCAALRQAGHPPRDGAGLDRKAFIQILAEGTADWRRDAAAAGGAMGDAARTA